jgi:hypothetical protein
MAKSIGDQLDDLIEALDEGSLSDWEESFVRSVMLQAHDNHDSTTGLTGNQVEKIEQIWEQRVKGR